MNMVSLLKIFIHHKRKIHWVLVFPFVFFLSARADEGNKYAIKTVVIDPGHGGKDPGALGKNCKEKDIVLGIGLKLGKYIEENFDDVEVIYTRDKDVFVPLHERAEIANKNDADLFISIHANADPRKKAIGTETYAMGLHKNEQNLEVAKKENAVIVLEEDYTTRYEGFDPKSAESYIIFSLLQNTYLDQSLNFANYVQGQFRDRAKRIDRGVKQAGFLVLWQTTMPSILIETGFLSHPDEETFLNSELGQDYLASAIYRAFRDYKQTIESKSVFVQDNPEPAPTEKPVKPETRETSTSAENQNTAEKEGKGTEGTIKDKISFSVQITSSSKSISLESDYFKDCKDIDGHNGVKILYANGLYKYAIGNEDNYNSIVKWSKKVKNVYPDAFVIATRNGEVIPVGQALEELEGR
jgi:N-acetylmuramoyl-L-alanine amidase